ncbi:MAG TPA: nucleotidyltransferase family protein, partial [Sphingomicrobium sp.]|nr:nucleotidyltransferase family protein [Sphingomicrobium sp.]
ARRHRVQGLAWNALAQYADQLPSDAVEMLSSEARAIAATNLGIAAECSGLRHAFAQADVRLLFVKGLSVGALAYRSPMLKMGWDIDLLVDPTDLVVASGLLAERGYSLRLPGSVDQLQAWHGWSKESVWTRDGSFHVELHTRLADNPRLIPAIDVHSPRQMVEIAPRTSLPTLAEEELFAYLAVHGASSAWFRLKWISDFAALLHGRRADEIERLYRRSLVLGAARAAGQALLLADRLFDTLEPIPALREELRRDQATRLLCSAALRLMTNQTREPTEKALGTLPIHWTQFLLQRGFAFKFAELRRQGASLVRR